MSKPNYQEFFYNQGKLIKVLFASNGNGHYKVKILSPEKINELPMDIDRETVEKALSKLHKLPRNRADESTDIISYLSNILKSA